MSNLLDFIASARSGVREAVGPRTTVREHRRRQYRDYYHATGQTHKDQARQAEYQVATRATADRHGEAWDANDLVTALKLQQPLMVSAQDAQRTYAAMRQGRFRLIRKAGFRNTLLKDEEAEFDALVRNVDATAEDWVALDEKWREVFAKTLPDIPSRQGLDWVQWEIDMLKDPTVSNASLAQKLGRTSGAIRVKRGEIRVTGARVMPRRWREDEVAIALDLSLTDDEVAESVGRTSDAVRFKRKSLRAKE